MSKELRAEVKPSDGETLWLRAIASPATKAEDRGLICFVAALDESPNAEGLDDLGKQGGFATILNSLRIGPEEASGGG